MSKGINKVILVGNLGNEPELMTFEGGGSVCNFSIATNEKWKDSQSGQLKERTEWHKIVAFGNLATICKQYLDKGMCVYVEGKLQTRKWTDKNGVDHYPVEINIHEMQMLDKRETDAYNAPRKPALHPDLQ